MGKKREYSNGEVTIVWEPEACIHSAICAKGLPNVFRPKVRPWIAPDLPQPQTHLLKVRTQHSSLRPLFWRNIVSG